MKNQQNTAIWEAYKDTAIGPFIHRFTFPILEVEWFESGGGCEHHFLKLANGIIVVNHDVCTVQVYATDLPTDSLIDLWADCPTLTEHIPQIPEAYRDREFIFETDEEEGKVSEIDEAVAYAEKWYEYLTFPRPQVFTANEWQQGPVFRSVIDPSGRQWLIKRVSPTDKYYTNTPDGEFAHPSAAKFFCKDTSGRGITWHATIEDIMAAPDQFNEDEDSLQDWAVNANSGDEFHTNDRTLYTCID